MIFERDIDLSKQVSLRVIADYSMFIVTLLTAMSFTVCKSGTYYTEELKTVDFCNSNKMTHLSHHDIQLHAFV